MIIRLAIIIRKAKKTQAMAMHHQLEFPGERQDLGEAAAGLTNKRRLESLARPISYHKIIIITYNVIIIISSYHYHVIVIKKRSGASSVQLVICAGSVFYEYSLVKYAYYGVPFVSKL